MNPPPPADPLLPDGTGTGGGGIGAQTVAMNYDDAGRRTSLTYPNTTSVAYGYDNAKRQ